MGAVLVCACVAWAIAAWPRIQQRYAVYSLIEAIEQKKGYPAQPRVPSLGLDPYYRIEEHIEEVKRLGGCNAAIQPLVALLRHEDGDVRHIAAFVFGEIACVGTDVVPSLITAWNDSRKSDARAGVLLAILHVATKGRRQDRSTLKLGVPAILDALQDTDHRVRWTACEVIKAVDPDLSMQLDLD